MKKRWLILFGVLFISMLVVGAVNAFTMGRVDGQWSCIEPQDGGVCGSAHNDTWATGPDGGNTDYDNETEFWTSYTPQSDYSSGDPSYTDWNQVRYGNPESSAFGLQSGFGFDGVDDIYEGGDGVLTEGEAFLLGKWCHFNNPITLDDPYNFLEYVNLEVRIDGITCPAGGKIDNDILEVDYRFTLNETPNDPPCPYPPDSPDPDNDPINAAGCADGVFLGATPLETPFVCDYGGGNTTDYKVTILGSVPLADPDDTCPDTPGSLAFEYYSAEGQDNCSCLYGQISEVTGTAVELNAFTAAFLDPGIELAWETASEVDNIGFNLYRSSSPIGMKVKLNKSMIPSQVIGSTSGASYRYLDEDLLAAGKYFYWLESIDLSGRSELNGSVEVFSFN